MLRSFEEIKEALHSGELTLPQLVENYLEQIEKNKQLNMYVEVWAEESLTRAKELQAAFDIDKRALAHFLAWWSP